MVRKIDYLFKKFNDIFIKIIHFLNFIILLDYIFRFIIQIYIFENFVRIQNIMNKSKNLY